MNARDKIVLDRLIAKPFAFLLNVISWPLGQIVRRDHDDAPERVKTIAITKLLGMGSILRAMPIVKALKQKYPSARYIFITAYKNKPLIEILGLFDNAFYIHDSSLFTIFIDTLGLIVKLWNCRIDLYFDLEIYSAFSTILAIISFARNRYGFYKDTTLFRLGLHTHLVYFNDSQHISKIYSQLIRACGIKNTNYKIEKITLQERHKQELHKWFINHQVAYDASYIVINPNASDLLLERRWPMEYFVLLIDSLVKNWHYPIFLVGSLYERDYVYLLYSKLSVQAKKQTVNIAGEVSIGAIMWLISNAQLMITNDSGLYHIAVSLDVRIISLWGPVNPMHYADIDNEKEEIFYCKEIYCSPCLHKTYFPPCRGYNICMKSISPRKVYKKSCEMLGVDSSFEGAPLANYQEKTYSDYDIIVRIPKRKKSYI